MSGDAPRSSTVGNQGAVGVRFGDREIRIDRDPAVAAPNYYTDAVLAVLAAWPRTPGTVLDVGVGTGVLAIAAASRWPRSRVDGIDVDPTAVELARRNVRLNDVGPERCQMTVSAARAYEPSREYDLVLANPPQIPVPPGDDSLSGGGPDGADVVNETIALADRVLAPKGQLLLALADFVPRRAIAAEIGAASFTVTVQDEVTCQAGAFTQAHRAWIERDGYRFDEGADGPEFRLGLLVIERDSGT